MAGAAFDSITPGHAGTDDPTGNHAHVQEKPAASFIIFRASEETQTIRAPHRSRRVRASARAA